jgi:Sporulation and spore germination
MKLLAVTVLVLAAGAAGWFIARRPEHAVSLGAPPRQVTTTATAERTGSLPSRSSFVIWLVRKGRLVEALRAHRPTPRVATAALDALLAGPTASERSSGLGTQIPPGTRLLGVSIARGVAHVDLSSDYENAAGSRALQLRLAQVVYTATQFPTVKAVRFSVDGTPVNVFSGGGLVLGHPVGRSAYSSLAGSAPLAGSWKQLPAAPLPALNARASAWSGRELLLLGRAGARNVFAAYVPARNTWRRLPPPPGRSLRIAWTGRELIAWGSAVSTFRSGRWMRLPGPPVAGPPRLLAWTGSELLGWTPAGGAAYRPGSGWRRLPRAPLTGSAAWTGSELIAVSGRSAAAFTPGRGWRRLPQLPEARPGANAVWDGSELLVVGGDTAPARGFAYSPAKNTWRELAPADSGRKGAAAVWSGSKLLLWGGQTGSAGRLLIPPHGLAYDPKTNSWSPLPQAPLRGRLSPVGAWTGRSLLVWGGDPGFTDGAAFTPSSS